MLKQVNFSVNDQPVIDILPQLVSKSPTKLTRPKANITTNYHWIAAGNFYGDNNRVILASGTPLCKTFFLHNKSNYFAAEPFINLDIAPNQEQRWKWFLIFM